MPPLPDVTIDLPMQLRLDAEVVSTTDDGAVDRTAEVIWSTGTVVRRRHPFTGQPYDEALSLDPKHVDLARLNAGAPVLNAHGRNDVHNVLGVVERAWIGDGPQGRATVRFSNRDDVSAIWKDIRGGILRNVSVGYRVRAFEVEDGQDKTVPVWRAIDWEPMEISVVPVGADPNTGFREAEQVQPCHLINRALAAQHLENEAMEDTNKAAEAQPAAAGANETTVRAVERDDTPPPIDDGHVERIIARERERIAGIHDAARKLHVDTQVADDLVRNGVTLADARAAIIETAATRDQQVVTRPHVRMDGLDERQTTREALACAILHRSNPDRYELTQAAREWRGLTLNECAREWLTRHGERVRGMSAVEIAERALHTTSDFPLLLANITGRTLRDAYAAAPSTYQAIARRVMATNFKDISRAQLGEAPQLLKVNEHGEFKRGTIGEAAETYRIATYGRVIGITRQTIINDDLDAFTRIPSLFGTSARTLESDLVWGIITANPVMADNVNIFHSTHKNLAGTGTALDVTNLGKGRLAMAKQLGLDAKTILNIRPAFLVVGSSLELAAEQIIAQNLVPATTSNVVPASIRSLAVIAEPRLDPASGAVPWYLFASPANIDTIEYAYLEGSDGVQMDSRIGFDVDGIEIKARLDFGCKAIEFRGMYKNPGVSL